MTFRLTTRGRTLLLFLSAAAYTASYAGLGERTDAQGARAIAELLPFAVVAGGSQVAAAINRDPFAGEPQPADSTPHVPDTAGVIVPNITEPATTPRPISPPIVRATIVGARSVAYVAHGSSMDIVRVGDTLDGRQIASIDLQGVSLSDGTRLDLPGNLGSSAAAAAPVARTIVLRLDDLRRLFVQRTKPWHAPQPATAPSIRSTESEPTAAPLPTADDRGLTVGTNPTSNPDAPTARPYPYPYAPPR